MFLQLGSGSGCAQGATHPVSVYLRRALPPRLVAQADFFTAVDKGDASSVKSLLEEKGELIDKDFKLYSRKGQGDKGKLPNREKSFWETLCLAPVGLNTSYMLLSIV